MCTIKPFRGLRPQKELASQIASLPYDVMSSEEARQMAKDNPYSFLHVTKPEIDLPPATDVYSDAVYAKGRDNLVAMIQSGYMLRESAPCLYVYRQIMGSHSQTGIVAGASVDEYQRGIIKKHELTRADKEEDRVKHVDRLNAQTGPVFLTYKAAAAIDAQVGLIASRQAQYDLTAEDGVRHTVWVVDSPSEIEFLVQAFKKIDCLYVADGHHRSAAASRVCDARRDANSAHTGKESYNFFLTVIFPDNQMQIMDYNRVVKDLNGLSADVFLMKIAEKFTVEKTTAAEKPAAKHAFAMFLEKQWYRLTAKAGTFNENEPVARLDVSILMDNLLAPLLGVGDPRKDKRIDFVGGIRGLGELQRRVDSGEMKVAFALSPTSIDDLMTIADAGQIMPPKSTWFEPKLRDGLVVHMLDE
jgi:uncharacterized protein (DUF1015 family)